MKINFDHNILYQIEECSGYDCIEPNSQSKGRNITSDQ